jgi:hypothetical protein
MSQKILIKTNLIQNQEGFKLGPLEEQPALLKFNYLKKILDPPQEDPKDQRTYTIKCLIKGCL